MSRHDNGAKNSGQEFRERLKPSADYAGIEYSQTAIARSLGASKQTVDRWMAGGEPRPAMVFHIADSWGVDARWLATGEGEMIPLAGGQGLRVDEHELIHCYRNSDTDRRKALREVAKAFGAR